MFKSGEFLIKFGHKLLLSLSAQPDYVQSVGKIVGRTLCFMYQGIFRPDYILITMLIFRFSSTKIPFDLF